MPHYAVRWCADLTYAYVISVKYTSARSNTHIRKRLVPDIVSPFLSLLLSLPCRHQLQCPGQYSPLEAFYEDKRAVLPPTGNGLVTACPTWSVTTINRCMHPEMKVWKQHDTCDTLIARALSQKTKKVSFFCLLSDNPPSWLHVPIHPVFRGADNGAMEVCTA